MYTTLIIGMFCIIGLVLGGIFVQALCAMAAKGDRQLRLK